MKTSSWLSLAIDYARGFVLIGAFCTLGFALVALLDIPFPPPLLGLAALVVALRVGIVRLAWIETAGSFLLRHMSLFFLPILLGAARFLAVDTQTFLVLALTLIGGTVLTLLTTYSLGRKWLVMPRSGREGEPL